MNPAAPIISAPAAPNTPDAIVLVERPDLNPLDYANLSIMDASTVCSHIGLTHSNTVLLFVIKTHTYKSPALRNFAITIANYFNPSKGYAYPSQPRLCEELDASRQTISKWTRELEESGYWTVERGSEGKANRFTFPFVEFAHIRGFMAAESRGELYIRGGLFRKVIAEAKQGAAGVSRPSSAGGTKESSPAETQPIPVEAEMSSPEAPVVGEPEPMEPDTADTEQTETIPEQDATESTPAAEHAPAAKWTNRSVTDEQTAIIVSSTVDAGLCLDETGARSSVRDAISKESDRDPSLSPAQLKEIAHGNLSAGILSGKWTRHNPARINELLAATATTVQEVGEQMEDPFALPDDLN